MDNEEATGQQMSAVSVIIPVFNGESTIERAIRSAVNQSYPPARVIVIDDGSTDQTLSAVEKMLDRHDNLRVISIDNGGVSNARNLGIERVKTEYILFLDADDVLLPNAIEILTKCMDHNVDVACGGYITGNIASMNDFPRTRDFDRVPRFIELSGEETLATMLRSQLVSSSVWAKLYRRSSIGGIRFDKRLSFAEDLEFNARILSNSHRVKITDQKVYFYAEEISSVTRQPATVSSLQTFSVLHGLPHTTPALKRAVVSREFVEAMQLSTRLVSKDDRISKFCTESLIRTARPAARDRYLGFRWRLLGTLTRCFGADFGMFVFNISWTISNATRRLR